MDPIQLSLAAHRFAAIAEEMGVSLGRTAFSPNIKERLDFSCALFDGRGRMLAQAAHIPVHLGSMPLSVEAALALRPPGPGDVVLLNDPFRGGTHLPDLTVVAGVFLEGPEAGPTFHVANRAHHADVGGMTAGSMPASREIYQEGLVLPPVRIVAGGEIVPDLLEVILANVRTPDERRGDLAAQLAALEAGRRRLEATWARCGGPALREATEALLDAGERRMAALLESIPDGRTTAEDFLDDDGFGSEPVRIAVAIEIDGGRATVDFDGTAPPAAGPMNATAGITRSAVQYAFLCLAGDDLPVNAGVLRPLDIRIPPGCLLDARRPAAVAGGNVETSQRIVDVVLGALAAACPGRIGAASCGSMNNVLLGGTDGAGRPFTYYETIAGGMGARPGSDGLSGVHTHMTNTRNTPIEALERHYPVRVERYAVRRGSGGTGRHRGGDGLVRVYEALAGMEMTILSERRRRPPPGAAGGRPGACGRNLLRRDGQEIELPGKVVRRLSPGDRLVIETPGGGGWGRADR